MKRRPHYARVIIYFYFFLTSQLGKLEMRFEKKTQSELAVLKDCGNGDEGRGYLSGASFEIAMLTKGTKR
jgi:hypothetical protein